MAENFARVAKAVVQRRQSGGFSVPTLGHALEMALKSQVASMPVFELAVPALEPDVGRGGSAGGGGGNDDDSASRNRVHHVISGQLQRFTVTADGHFQRVPQREKPAALALQPQQGQEQQEEKGREGRKGKRRVAQGGGAGGEAGGLGGGLVRTEGVPAVRRVGAPGGSDVDLTISGWTTGEVFVEDGMGGAGGAGGGAAGGTRELPESGGRWTAPSRRGGAGGGGEASLEEATPGEKSGSQSRATHAETEASEMSAIKRYWDHGARGDKDDDGDDDEDHDEEDDEDDRLSWGGSGSEGPGGPAGHPTSKKTKEHHKGRKTKNVKHIEADEEVLRTYHDSFLYGRLPYSMRARVVLRSGWLGILINTLDFFAALAGVILYVMVTYDKTTATRSDHRLESFAFIGGFFAVTYALKVYSAHVRLQYILSYSGVVDFISMLSFVFYFAGVEKEGSIPRFILFLRVLRPLKSLKALGVLKSTIAQQILVLIVSLLSITFISASMIQWVELEAQSAAELRTNKCPPTGCISFIGGLYFVVVTLSTVGYGDITMNTDWGRLVVIFVIIVAVLVVPSQINDIVETASRSPYGGNFSARKLVGSRYIILCGDVTYAAVESFLAQFYHPVHSEDLAAYPLRIVVMAPYKPSFELKTLLGLYNGLAEFIEGSPINLADMDRVSARSASAIFVIGRGNPVDREMDDAAQMVRALAVHRHCGARVRVVVEITEPEAVKSAVWDDTDNAIELICLEELRLRLLATSCFVRGLTPFVVNLFRTSLEVLHPMRASWMYEYYAGHLNEVYPVIIPPLLCGLRFEEFAEFVFLHFGVVALGLDLVVDEDPTTLAPERQVFLLPKRHVIAAADVAIVVAPSLHVAEKVSRFGLHGDTCRSNTWSALAKLALLRKRSSAEGTRGLSKRQEHAKALSLLEQVRASWQKGGSGGGGRAPGGTSGSWGPQGGSNGTPSQARLRGVPEREVGGGAAVARTLLKSGSGSGSARSLRGGSLKERQSSIKDAARGIFGSMRAHEEEEQGNVASAGMEVEGGRGGGGRVGDGDGERVESGSDRQDRAADSIEEQKERPREQQTRAEVPSGNVPSSAAGGGGQGDGGCDKAAAGGAPAAPDGGWEERLEEEEQDKSEGRGEGGLPQLQGQRQQQEQEREGGGKEEVQVERVSTLEEAVDRLLSWPPAVNSEKPNPAILHRRRLEIERHLAEHTLAVVAGAGPFERRPHVLICVPRVWPNLFYVVAQLRRPQFRQLPVVVLHARAPTFREWGTVGLFDDVFFVRGSPENELDLMRAGVVQAAHVMVMVEEGGEADDVSADDVESPRLVLAKYRADVSNICIAATVERLAGCDARVSVQLQHEDSMRYLRPKFALLRRRRLGARAYRRNRSAIFRFAPPYICGKAASLSVISFVSHATFYNRNTVNIINMLLSGSPVEEPQSLLGDEGDDKEGHTHTRSSGVGSAGGSGGGSGGDENEELRLLRQINVPLDFEGRTYGELWVYLLHKKEALALGLYRALGTKNSPTPYVFTNPSAQTIVLRDDLVYVLR